MLVALLILLMTSVAFGQPAPGGGGVISSLTQLNPALCEDSEGLFNNNQQEWVCSTPPGGGSPVALDLGDDSVLEATDLIRISVTGDTNSVFTESPANDLLIDLAQNWPVADTADALSADPSDCLSGSAPVGVNASGTVVDCTDYEEDLSNSAGLAAALSDETGTGVVVFGTAPTLDSPALITPVLSLPDGSVGAPTADGVIEYDRTAERLQVGDGSGTSEFVKTGTLTDTQVCTWDDTGKEIDCDTVLSAGSLDQAFDNGKIINGATSQANAMQVGNGVVAWLLYCDASDVCHIETSADSDTQMGIATNFNWIVYDLEAGAAVLTIDPDAGSSNAVYQFGANYQPVLTKEVVLRPIGDCSVAEEAIVTNDPLDEWVTCEDTSGDAVTFSLKVTTKIAGNTALTITMLAVNKNASPSGTFTLACAARSARPGTDAYAAHSTTGQQNVSFATFDTQSRPEEASATFTVNGTIAAGAHIKGQCNVSAAPAQIADIRLSGTAMVEVSANSLSD